MLSKLFSNPLKSNPLQSEINHIFVTLGRIFYEFGLVSDTRSLLAGRYQLPLAPAGDALLVSGWLKIPIRMELLPKGVFVEDLQSPRLLTALRLVLGRNVETRLAPVSPISGLFFENADKSSVFDVASQYEFWYFIEMDGSMLRSIPRYFPFQSIPFPPGGRLPVLFGVGVSGSPIWYDFPQEVIGLLVGGATRSGKSVFLRSILSQLLNRYNSDYFRCFLADFKFGVEFGQFRDRPQVTLFEDAARLTDFISSEVARRFSIIKEYGCLNILELNDSEQADFMPYCLAVIDEMTMFKLKAGKSGMDDLILLVSQSAGAGIYWVLSTQRPSVDIVSGSLKANLGARVSSSQATQVDYDVIFGEGVIQQSGPLGCPGRFWGLVGDNLFEFQSPYL